ncbi:MAG: outer membrane protein assembly factor BamD [Calditrichaeota bacterium]|nr:MAG: outer membrane protein assembly factor BamD [Calditrichota bacterium]
MKFKIFYCSLLFLGLTTNVFSQNKKGKWGFGAGGTMSNVTASEAVQNSAGFGGEGIISYLFNDKFSLNLVTGYNKFSSTPLANAAELSTSLISSALTLEYEMKLMQSFRPFLSLGIGAHNYTVGGSDRFSDGEGLAGLGTRFYLGKRSAIYVAGLFKYTTGDAIDGLDVGGTDLYYNVSAGVQFFRGKNNTKKIDEPKVTGTPFDNMPPVDSLLVEELAEVENDGTAVPLTEEEKRSAAEHELEFSLTLKKDELMEKLSSAEQEINKLRNEIADKSKQIENLERAQQNTEAVNPDKIQGLYANSLALFNKRKYSEASQILEELLQLYPNHRLKSNFIYWTGENYYARKKYFQAAAEFEKVLGFPHSVKRDDSLLMLGRTYLQLGDISAANANFERLIVEFPRSEFKQKAEKYMQPQSVPAE